MTQHVNQIWHPSRRQVIIGVLGIALFAGLILLLLTRAAGPFVSVEPEGASLSGAVQIINDSTASGGQAIRFGAITTPPPPPPPPVGPPPPPPTACSGPTINLTGTTSARYTNKTAAAGTTFNLTGWYSNAVTGNGASQAFDVGDARGPICTVRGVVNGHIDPALDWRTVHDSIGGFGYRTAVKGLGSVDGARIHNVEDGWKPRECPTTSDSCSTFSNVGIMSLKNAYMTGIRDDAIEDDDFMPGDITDSLFDGIWCFLSEQQQGSTGSGVGSGEDTHIRITRSYIRLYPTNSPAAGDNGGPGHWFKWQGSTSHHTPIVTDSVFAVDHQPRGGWSALDIPAGTQWVGSNFILWLGPTGGYAGPRPSGVTFMEGQAAKDKWNAVRNPWLTGHGYQARPVDDFNPMDDPVVAAQ